MERRVDAEGGKYANGFTRSYEYVLFRDRSIISNDDISFCDMDFMKNPECRDCA